MSNNPPSAVPTGTTNTKFDQLLDPYFPQRSGRLLYQLMENRTDALLAALLMEMQIEHRGNAGFPSDDRPEQQEAEYFVTEQPLQISSHRESDNTMNWGFPASSVMIWGYEDPIRVSFRSSGDHRKFPLDPDDTDPFVPAPEGGLDTSMAAFSLPDSDSEPTTVKVAAFR